MVPVLPSTTRVSRTSATGRTSTATRRRRSASTTSVTPGGWSVRAVDLPVYSVGDTREEAAESIREAIAFYLEEGQLPESSSEVGTVTV